MGPKQRSDFLISQFQADDMLKREARLMDLQAVNGKKVW